MKISSKHFKAKMLCTLTITAVMCYSLLTVQGSTSLYSYVMDTFSKEYTNVEEAKRKLEHLQKEYSLAMLTNLQVESFESLSAYAREVEVEVNTKIDNEIDYLQSYKDEVSFNVENNLNTLAPKELSKYNREYKSYDDDISSLLKDKSSISSLFETPNVDSIDTSYLESSIEEQQSIISYSSSITGTDLGSLELLKRPFSYRVRVTSPAGYRVHPIHGTVKYHNATDYGMPEGTELYSLFNGSVVMSSYSSVYGNNIKVDCGNGIIVHYAHLKENLVAVGDKVIQNQLIGYSGNTGLSTGPHLHLGLYIKGETLSVEDLFNG